MDQDELIDAQFNRAVEIVQSLPKNGPIQTAYEDKLEMYSLFKQATVGDVESARPALWDVLGRAKWDSWEKQRGLDQQQAKWLYVQTLQKVLRRYSDRTVARDLVRELDSYGTDPSHLVMSGSLVQHSDDDSSSSSSARPQQVGGRSRPTSLQFPQAAPPINPDTTVMSQTYHDAESEEPGGEESDDEAEREDILQPVLSPPAAASTFRPSSAMSSQMRYRTPMANAPAFSPTPVAGTVASQSTQPLPRYATPSAFGQQASPFPQAPQSHGSHPSIPYVQYPAATGSTVGYYPPTGGRSSVTQTTVHPAQRTALERAIEGMQASLAALHERLDALEAQSTIRTPLGSPFAPRGGGSPVRGLSPAGSPSIPFDPHKTGPWAIILAPLSRLYVHAKHLLVFLAYPPHPTSTSARLLITRRLLLDASFVIFVLGVLRAVWKATGIRRREVSRALVVLWHAIAGKQAKVLVDKGT